METIKNSQYHVIKMFKSKRNTKHTHTHTHTHTDTNRGWTLPGTSKIIFCTGMLKGIKIFFTKV